MRLLEILVYVTLGAALLGRFVNRSSRPRWVQALAWVALGAVALQVIAEGPRWQLYPAYALAVLLAAFSLRSGTGTAKRSWWRTAGRAIVVLASLAVLAVSALLAAGMPMFEYPAPSGPHAVGTVRLAMVDRARTDPFAPKAGTPRELLVVAWYPADVKPGSKPSPFWPADTSVEAATGLPPFMFSHLERVPAHSYADAPLSGGGQRLPVVVYSHGYNSSPWQNSVQMEELASHGYVVFSIAHTYDSSRVLFPDGRVVMDNSRTRGKPFTPEQRADWMNRLKEADAERDPEALRRLWREQKSMYTFADPSVPVWVADVRFVLDQLAAMDAGDAGDVTGAWQQFSGRLDLGRIGVMGQSFGGSTAGLVCMQDRRCRAGVNMDGYQFGVKPQAMPVPFMFMANDSTNNFAAYDSSAADLYQVRVLRSAHGDFSALPLIAPLFSWISRPGMALLGKVDGAEVQRIMNAYLLAFFDRYLLGEPQPLLEATTPQPGLEDAKVTLVPPGAPFPAAAIALPATSPP